MTRLPWFIRLALLVPVAALLAPPGAARADEPVVPLPRGAATVDLKSGYLTSYKHSVYGLDLTTGKATWESGIDGLPLTVEDGRVLILVPDRKKPNVATVVSVNPLIGRIGWRSDDITFPEWAAVVPTDTQYFGHLVRVRDGALWVKWLALARKPGGKVPTHKEAGVAVVDLVAHTVRMLDATKMPPPRVPPGVTKNVEKLAARPVETPAGPETRVATAGGNAVAVDVERNSVVLKRWNLKTETPLPPVVLASNGPFVATLFPEARAVVVRPAPTGKPAKAPVFWQVFSLETGKRLLRLKVEADTTQPTILGPTLYYAFLGPYDAGQNKGVPVPTIRQLRAIDLKTGRSRWACPLESVPWELVPGSFPDNP